MVKVSVTYCKVAINSLFSESITFYLEDALAGELKVGMLVNVPLGKRVVEGCVLESSIKEEQLLVDFDRSKIKAVIEKNSFDMLLSPEYFSFLEWVSNYYHYPIGMLIFDILPKSKVAKKQRELKFIKGVGEELPFDLNDKQKMAVDKISESLDKGFSKWLVHGVTGSGKSAIYIKLMSKVLTEGKSVLFLLPEINLTPQFLEYFKRFLATSIYSYNSSINSFDRYGLWMELVSNISAKLVVGVRSAIFLPIQNLGLIIVDEEHDNSFKQDGHCSYNARDMALKLGSLKKIPVVLGSATPSVETYYAFTSKQPTNYIPLETRAGEATMPDILMVDSKNDTEEHWPLTTKSVEEIRAALDKNEQVLVFINRLGYSAFLQCRSCGYTFKCPNCSVSLKYYQYNNQLRCSYCDYKDKAPEICPECSNLKIFKKGFGTEKVQEVLAQLFPNKRVERFDRDEITTIKKLESRLESFHSGEIDILVGTQMLSKGHNFQRVNLVLILGIDSQLNRPDFRSNERVYQLLTQVSGRSGRYSGKSNVLIQTLSPEDELFTIVKEHSFDRFYKDELAFRLPFGCPPYGKIVMIYISSRFADKVKHDSRKIADTLLKLKHQTFKTLTVLGPRPAIIEKKANKYTWSIMLSSDNVNELHNVVKTIKNGFDPSTGVSIQYDIDPYTIF